jgi:hypothetical protein
MAKQRYVQDSFWTDPYIERLTPDEKLVFLHLLTNPQCNVAGVYELRAKRLAYETGYDTEVVETILKRFQKDKKIIRFKEWIVIVNHIKHQNLGDLTAEGINRVIKQTPEEIQDLFIEKSLINTKGKEYTVMVLDNQIPLTSPLQAPTAGAYSEVKLSIIKLNNNKLGEFENVSLSDEELGKLYDRFTEQKTKECIEELSSYMASKGKRYSNHYATLLNWCKRKGETKNYKTKSVTII